MEVNLDSDEDMAEEINEADLLQFQIQRNK